MALFIAYITLLLTIIGWFVNAYINRRHEIFNKALDYRVETLKLALKIYSIIEHNSAPFTDPDFLPLLEKTRGNFRLYGKNDEIEKFENFIGAINKKDLQLANDALSELVSFVVDRIRHELHI